MNRKPKASVQSVDIVFLSNMLFCSCKLYEGQSSFYIVFLSNMLFCSCQLCEGQSSFYIVFLSNMLFCSCKLYEGQSSLLQYMCRKEEKVIRWVVNVMNQKPCWQFEGGTVKPFYFFIFNPAVWRDTLCVCSCVAAATRRRK